MVDREVGLQHVFSLIFFFDIFDGWLIVKLTSLCGWSWVALGASVCGSGSLLGAYVGGLEAVLGPMLAILSCSWASTGGPGSHVGPL